MLGGGCAGEERISQKLPSRFSLMYQPELGLTVPALNEPPATRNMVLL